MLPMNAPPIEYGAVRIDGECIRKIGSFAELESQGHDKVVDLGDCVLLPGLINAHCHLELTDMVGQTPCSNGFTGWLKQIVALKRSWEQPEYERSALRGVDMLLGSGATTVCDVVSWWPLVSKLQAGKLRLWSCLEMIDFAGQRSWRDWVETASSWIRKFPNPRGGWGISPHAPYTATAELYRAAAEFQQREPPGNLLMTTHLCESAAERDMFEEGGGEMYEWLVRLGRDMYDCGGWSSLQLLDRRGVLGTQTLGVHLNGLDDSEIEIVTRSGMSAVHCPTSHRFFSHPAFPMEQLLARGVNVCIGTDSLASAPVGSALDMFAELRLLRQAFPRLSAETILQLATVNGAKALHAADRLGTLEPGKHADVIGLRIPPATKLSDLYESVICGNLPLAFVMIHGEQITR